MPPPKDDDTFASTLTGIDELRHSRDREDDWQSWRRVVLAALRAGKRTEEEVDALKLRAREYALQGAQERLSKRVEALEKAEARHSDRRRRMLSWLARVGLLVLTWALGRFGGHQG